MECVSIPQMIKRQIFEAQMFII